MLPKGRSEPAKPRFIKLIFGAYDLDEPSQSGTFSAAPSEIIIHDDWNPNSESFDADIALLTVDDEIPSTRLIKPICLWEGKLVPRVKDGWIAGWGKSASSAIHENIPKQLNIPVVNSVDCLLDNHAFSKVASRRTFCGGSKTDSGPCMGENEL